MKRMATVRAARWRNATATGFRQWQGGGVEEMPPVGGWGRRGGDVEEGEASEDRSNGQVGIRPGDPPGLRPPRAVRLHGGEHAAAHKNQQGRGVYSPVHGAPQRRPPARPRPLSAPAITTPCSSGTTTTVTLSANTTDGANPLSPVSFAATATCAAAPSGAAGVAGLGCSSASFPAQVASMQKVANSFALCLPSDGRTGFSGNGVGAAIFGGGPFYLAPPADREAITTLLSNPVPLRQPFAGNPGYFVTATGGIAIDGSVAAPGPLVVGLSTTVTYTQLRADVYRLVIAAFDRALGQTAKVSAVSPFELCYDSSKLGSSLSGYFVPQVDVLLEGGTNLMVVGGNSMAQVNSGTACFAFSRRRAARGRRC
ncbi:hypothetical protein ACQ4PT_033792 [Festuca glaucescens]